MFWHKENKDTSVRTGNQVTAIKQDFNDNLTCIQGRFSPIASKYDYYMALVYTVRDRMMHCWSHTAKTYLAQASRTVCYLSAEFLIGPQLGNNINNLGIYKEVRQSMEDLGLNLNELLEQEVEPGLGNGGLGRLAACYMDSLATLGIPAIGYGIRYEFGIFNQEIKDGWQVENTDKWLRNGNPWEIPRPEVCFDIKFGGHTESYLDTDGNYRVNWVPDDIVKSVAHDIPVLGYQANTANFIRLWRAEACESFDFKAFNLGDYYGSVNEKISSENITKVLYPNDEPVAGKKLRLKQQYFFVSSSLRDMIRLYQQRQQNLENFHEKFAVQLNDTHPAIGIAELMRLLVDEHHMDWDKAWGITQKTFCYTNHTILPEALEKWPLEIFASILPRHLEIIFEINRVFLNSASLFFHNDIDKIRSLSIIDENGQRYVRMANLACIGSHSINGVSSLHTELLKSGILKDFFALWPEKFNNKTNGVTPRRFLMLTNPKLTSLINEAIGTTWIKDLYQLKKLEQFIDDSSFLEKWLQIKYNNKIDLATFIAGQTENTVDPSSLFDIQAKRIHEYKRQHLNILHAIALYNRIRNNKSANIAPRTIIFAGKAAPGYFLAKLMIKLATAVGDMINNDIYTKDLLKEVFIPNYNVKNAQWIHPAADLSEQISTAGMEASGTGNMKFAMNGALTIGTLDGANVEMREEIGAENFFLFGLKTEQVASLKQQGYNPQDYINANEELKMALELISSGYFSQDKNLFKPLLDTLTYQDRFMVCADFKSYVDCQDSVGLAYQDKQRWAKMSILNTARMGKFSSDRAIQEYCNDIWQVKPVEIIC